MTGINYGASSDSSAAHSDAATAYANLISRAATSSTKIAAVMDGTRRYPGVYTCIPNCNLGGGVLTLDAQGVSSFPRVEAPELYPADCLVMLAGPDVRLRLCDGRPSRRISCVADDAGERGAGVER